MKKILWSERIKRPPKALTFETYLCEQDSPISSHPDGGPVFIDHTLCAGPFSNDNGCSLCLKYCPVSYADYDRLKAKFEEGHNIAKTDCQANY
jgi:hypothetical protein